MALTAVLPFPQLCLDLGPHVLPSVAHETSACSSLRRRLRNRRGGHSREVFSGCVVVRYKGQGGVKGKLGRLNIIKKKNGGFGLGVWKHLDQHVRR